MSSAPVIKPTREPTTAAGKPAKAAPVLAPPKKKVADEPKRSTKTQAIKEMVRGDFRTAEKPTRRDDLAACGGMTDDLRRQLVIDDSALREFGGLVANNLYTAMSSQFEEFSRDQTANNNFTSMINDRATYERVGAEIRDQV